MSSIGQAFVLGAGLGTRLRPLTEWLPKPLIPVWNRPLITYAFDHLIAELDVGEFMVNTHHCSEVYERAFPDGRYQGRDLSFRHEPVLLDTAGGIDNIRDWLKGDESFVVYNGDILTDLPLKEAWVHHCESGNLATLVLRSHGDELRVGFDEASGQVVDLRGHLQPDWKHRCQFTGIYFVSPEFLRYLRPGKIESVVLCFLEAIRAGEKIGGFISDLGEWSDLGEREAYLDSLSLADRGFPSYLPQQELVRISDTAFVHPTASVDRYSVVGPGCRIGADVRLVESILWEASKVVEGAKLERVVVRNDREVEGEVSELDV